MIATATATAVPLEKLSGSLSPRTLSNTPSPTLRRLNSTYGKLQSPGRSSSTIGLQSGLARDQGIRIVNGSFYRPRFGKVPFLIGVNIVVKGPPWFPSTSAAKKCENLEPCTTFSAHDIEHMRQINPEFNAIRLSVAWAGAQPNSSYAEYGIDRDFARRLRDVLRLCEEHDVYVVLDVHQDALASRFCGEGVPDWIFGNWWPSWTSTIQQKSLDPSQPGQSTVGCSEQQWQLYKGDVDYNVRNPCCVAANDDNVWSDNLLRPWTSAMSTSTKLQWMLTLSMPMATFRRAYIRYMRELAKLAEGFSTVVGIEMFNEPELALGWWELFRAVDEELQRAESTVLLGIPDIWQTQWPWLSTRWKYVGWRFPRKGHQFYAYHGTYGSIDSADRPLDRASALDELRSLGVPSICTECDCSDYVDNARAVSHGYLGWHYHEYCNTPDRKGRAAGAVGATGLTPERFGACITGYGSANTSCVANMRTHKKRKALLGV